MKSSQEAHAIFFEKIGGAYRTMVYDNTKVAIKRFVGRNEKEPTEGLLKLSIYYGFRFRFCNANAGHEKGHVERSVEYIRRKAFAFRDRFGSIEEANLYLESVCHKLNSIPQKLNNNQTANEIFAAEKAWLLQRMPVFDTAKTLDVRVDKYSTVAVDTCRYSVPDHLVGKMVFVKAYNQEIICFNDDQKIAEHQRKYGFNEWNIKIEHYVDTLKKKPGALSSSVALNQANPRLQEIYQKYYIKKEKEFIELLLFMRENSLEKIEAAIKMLEKVSPIDISTEKIKTICNRNVIEKPQFTKESEITTQSKEMLLRFKQLIPASTEDFTKEVAII